MQNPICLRLKRLQTRPRMIVLLILIVDCIIIYAFVGRTLVLAQDQRETNPPITNRSALVEGNTAFAFDLYHQLTSEQDGNFIFSPYSISLEMALLFAGAKGETAAQIADTLHFKLPQDQFHPAFNALDLALKRTQDEPSQPTPTIEYINPAVDLTLTIANALWMQKGLPIEQTYLETLEKNYGVGVKQTDFSANPDAAQQTISHWVEKNTRGRIKDMPPPGSITSQTQLALINAIYFKGEWSDPFDTIKTYDGSFNLMNGDTVTIPMMVGNFTDTLCLKADDYQAIELTYGQSKNTSMMILLPDEGTFKVFESRLNVGVVKEIREKLPQTHGLTFQLPRFSFDSKIDLRNTLSTMGMSLPFSTESDFTGISPNSGLSINYAEHEAAISVDEQGTEAIGVTSVLALLLGGGRECGDEVIADRPFIFIIYDHQTDTILFIGRVMNPAA